MEAMEGVGGGFVVILLVGPSELEEVAVRSNS